LEQVSPIQQTSPLATEASPGGETETFSPPSTPPADRSAIMGQLVSARNGEPIVGVVVRLGRVFWNESETDGAFAIEAASSPSDITDQNGEFFINDFEPASYVIVAGELEGNFEVVAESDSIDDARIFKTEAGKITKAGVLRIGLSRP
jgi:hypothetical protein